MWRIWGTMENSVQLKHEVDQASKHMNMLCFVMSLSAHKPRMNGIPSLSLQGSTPRAPEHYMEEQHGNSRSQIKCLRKAWDKTRGSAF